MATTQTQSDRENQNLGREPDGPPLGLAVDAPAVEDGATPPAAHVGPEAEPPLSGQLLLSSSGAHTAAPPAPAVAARAGLEAVGGLGRDREDAGGLASDLNTGSERGNPPCWPIQATTTERITVIPRIDRFRVQVLLQAGHTQRWVAEHTEVSERSVRRIGNDAPINDLEHEPPGRPRVGNPGKIAGFVDRMTEWLEAEPGLKGVEIFQRLKQAGYAGGNSAMYEALKPLRKHVASFVAAFEALPGEFSQHDFGEVLVTFTDGRRKKYRFFATKMKYSRWVHVTLVPDQRVESLVRAVAEHFEALGGIPLLAVFDRPKTIVTKSRKNGKVVKWNQTFAHAMFDLGVAVELCWPYAANQKGAVENLVGWVKGSFFSQRRFVDEEDLLAQLAEWLWFVNHERPSRATGQIPAERLPAELRRLRPIKESADTLALRFPCVVGPTAMVRCANALYSMDPESVGYGGTIFLYRDRIVIEAGQFRAEHPRLEEAGARSVLPAHRTQQLALVHGRRGKNYLMRQHILEVGGTAEAFLSELVFRKERGWHPDVQRLHVLLQDFGPAALEAAFATAITEGIFRVEYVEGILRERHQPRLVGLA
jgi:transposase